MSYKPFWDLIQENLGPDFVHDRELHAAVRELSLAFTEERDQLPADYLSDPEIQTAYLAYFVPLNFEKIRTLLSSQAGVWPKELPKEPLRWIDLGAGPGTAVLAALAAYKNRYKKIEKLPPVHIDLVDTQSAALALAETLLNSFASKLGLEITIGLHPTLPSARNSSGGKKYDLALAANVLNELPADSGPQARELLMQLWDLTSGVLFVLEPGHRVSSQRLVRFRERLLKEDAAHADILGPCLHTEKCPVHRTKHWCHFSEPVHDGRLIDLNLRVFKNPRGWLKFSYLLIRRGEHLTKTWDKKRYRAIGDLHPVGPKRLAIDLCMPSEKFVLSTSSNIPPELRLTLVRGATVTLGEDYKIDARPLTKRELRPDTTGPLPPRGKKPKRPQS